MGAGEPGAGRQGGLGEGGSAGGGGGWGQEAAGWGWGIGGREGEEGRPNGLGAGAEL